MLAECCLLVAGYSLAMGGYATGPRKPDGNKIRLHVLAWEKYHRRKVPKGEIIMHLCDVRACVRPSHLMLGTRRDNALDMTLKNRQCLGEQHPRAKLTRQIVLQIRKSHESDRVLARRFGVVNGTINLARNGRTWR